jgi:hypothetical protein
MAQTIKEHMSALRETDLSGYTFERRHSDYHDYKSDLIIYDAQGEAVLQGREASDGRVSFWPLGPEHPDGDHR